MAKTYYSMLEWHISMIEGGIIFQNLEYHTHDRQGIFIFIYIYAFMYVSMSYV